MIQGIIDKAIANSRTERQKNRVSSGKFNISDAGKCRLMRYWKRKGKAYPEFDERALRIFEIGNIFEKWVLNMIKVPYQQQVLVEDEHRKGYADLILHTPEQRILYDIKTVHSRKFWNNEREGWEKVDRHYKCQVLTYNSMLPMPCDSLRLLYISKDDLCMREIGITGLESVGEGYKDITEYCTYDWDYLIQCWIDQVEPVANPMSWECAYCGFSDTCEHKITKKKGKKES